MLDHKCGRRRRQGLKGGRKAVGEGARGILATMKFANRYRMARCPTLKAEAIKSAPITNVPVKPTFKAFDSHYTEKD